MTSWIATLGAIADRRDLPELLDLQAGSQSDVEAVLADVDRYNRLFGGVLFLKRYVLPHLEARANGRKQLVLDVGCGAGEMARRVADHARRKRVSVRVIALDRDPRSLVAARKRTCNSDPISFVQADARALPFLESSIDVSYSTLVLHHLEPAAAARSLRSLRRVCRRAVLVNDLVRNRLAWWLFRIASLFLARNSISRDDGLTSIKRSYNPAEVKSIFERAGSSRVMIAEHPLFFRLTAVDELEEK